MNIVVDTNVLVAGLINPFGPPGRLIDLILSDEVTLHFDDRIIAEYRAVLARPRFGFDQYKISHLLDYILAEGIPVITVPISVSLADEDDRPFMECAVLNCVDCLVTGNTKHFPVQPGLVICTPSDFIAKWLLR